jgi:ribosomal protein S12 methylthiotransferase accessory factor
VHYPQERWFAPTEDGKWPAEMLNPELHKFYNPEGEIDGEVLADLQTSNLNDERPLREILGLAIPVGTVWKELRIGELKTLLALAIGDEEATREGCDWIHHYAQMPPARRLVYRCIESLMGLDNVDNYRRALVLLYGAETVRQVAALLDRSEKFFGLQALGADRQGSAMHQTLLAAYDKLFATAA